MGGMVLQTNMSDILARIEEQNKLVKQEVCTFIISVRLLFCFVNMFLLFINKAGLAAAPARAVSAVKSMNIPQQIKDMKLPDLPQAIKVLFCLVLKYM